MDFLHVSFLGYALWLWLVFGGVVVTLLALDLGVLHREGGEISVAESLWLSAGYIAVAVAFGGWLWWQVGAQQGMDYFTAYAVEKSLSLDNVFVISLVFTAFAVPRALQHRVLFWGILGALVLRGAMIALGAKLIAEFHWVLYLFALFLILTAIKMLFMKTEESDPNRNAMVRLTRRFFPVTARFHGEHFFVRAGRPASYESELPGAPAVPDEVVDRARAGTLLLTPLALALVMVETTDLIFAVDSIPAIFAITGDPFLVFTSNVFAILGLRSLYFALAGMVNKFRYLKTALALVLMVVGLKMLFAEWLKLALGRHFNLYLLTLVLVILAAGIGVSLLADRRSSRHQKAD